MKYQFKTFNMLRELKKEQDFYVFDVETWGLRATREAFALGVIYGKNYYYETDNWQDMHETLLSQRFKGKIIFAHNALYDLSTMFGNVITELDNKAIFNSGKFILAKYNGITFADSLNILPAKLSTIGDLLGMPKGETPEKFVNNIPGPLEETDFLYCAQDCKVIHKALEKVFTEIGCVRVTLASLSMAYFRRKFLKKPIFYNSNLIYEFFDSYYGGRVECFILGKTYAQKFDINSMYPYAMVHTKFPDPSRIKKIENPTLEQFLYYLEYYEGMAEITVKHKDTYFGYLPYRHKNKLCFPIGTFTGKWNLNEIRFALENKAIEIVAVNSIIYAPAIPSPFKDFVTTIYNRRRTSTNEFEKYQLKLILNSLYGKFAQKKATDTQYVEQLTTKILKQHPEAVITPFSGDRQDAFISVEKDEYSYNTIPSFSSYITSFARIELLKQMLKYKDNGIAYCDTDSIAMSNYTTEVATGTELGQFKKEESIITYIYGNKAYEEASGKLVIKGIPKDSTKLENGIFTTKSMVKPRGALRRNKVAGEFITTTKSIGKNPYDKRIVHIDGTTDPIEIKP